MTKKEYIEPNILVEELEPENYLQTGSLDEEIEKKEDDIIENIDDVI